MTQDEAKTALDAAMSSTEGLTSLRVQRLRRVYLELPEGDPSAPVRVRDLLVWLADLWADNRGAEVVLDDQTGELLKVEYV